MESRRALSALGIDAKEGLFTFEIDETDPRWPDISLYVKRNRLPDFIRTEFSPKELSEAEWLVMDAGWSNIYPQPADDFGFREATYDVTDYCAHCGVGAVQKAPFRLKGEPRWRNKDVFGLEWIYDEFFAKPEVWQDTFEPFGIGTSAVVNQKSGRALQTVVQLKIAVAAGSKVLLGDHPRQRCPECGRIKYSAAVQGRFPPLESFPNESAFKAAEYFGDGALAFRETIVSRVLYRSIMDHKIRGLAFRPVGRPGS